MVARTLGNLFGVVAPSSQARNHSNLNNPANSIDTWDGDDYGTRTPAGIRVSHSAAMRSAPVWQALSILSGDVASSTLELHKREVKAGQDSIDRTDLNYLISQEWNEETCAFEGWRRLVLHAELYGNGYAYLHRMGGRFSPVTEIINLMPDRTRPVFVLQAGDSSTTQKLMKQWSRLTRGKCSTFRG